MIARSGRTLILRAASLRIIHSQAVHPTHMGTTFRALSSAQETSILLRKAWLLVQNWSIIHLWEMDIFNASTRITLSIKYSFTTVRTPEAATAATMVRQPNSTRTRSTIVPTCTSSQQETMAIHPAAMPTSQECRGEISQAATNWPRTSSPRRTSPILIFLLPVQARDPLQTDGSNQT